MPPAGRRSNGLIWGCDMLEDQSRVADLQANWRGEAAELLGLFPLKDWLSRCNAGNPPQLQAFANVLISARSLLERVRAGETCSTQSRQDLQVLLRHFY
jgi:hypothetical protein